MLNRFETLTVNPSYNGDSDYLFLHGTHPVMLSAPHNVEHVRDNKIKYSEPATGILSMLLHEETGASCLVKTRNNNDDANYDEFSPFKQFLKQELLSRDYSFLIDIHQMSPSREQDVIIGTNYGANIVGLEELPDYMVNCFSQYDIHAVVDKIFLASGSNRVSSYVHKHTGVPAVQVELNSRFFDSGHDDYHPELIARALCDIVLYPV